MKRVFKIASLVAMFLSSVAIAHADEVGNGGDLVYCQKSADNPLDGYYTLDYVLTFRKSNNNEDLVPVESWDASRNRIQTILSEKLPNFARSFSEYISLLRNYDDYSQARIWNEAAFGLYDVSDENIKIKIPQNCYENNQVRLTQVVVRAQTTQIVGGTKIGQLTSYAFDYDRFHDLEVNRPLQFSFLMVHEWLRDYLDDAEQIRTITRFIHSKQFEEQSAEQIVQLLSRNGIYALPIKSEEIFELVPNNDFKKRDELCNYRVGFFDGGMVVEAIECGLLIHPTNVGLKVVLRDSKYDGKKTILRNLKPSIPESTLLNQNHIMIGHYLNIRMVHIINEREIDIFAENISNAPYRYTVRK